MAPQILHTGTQNRIAWKAGAREERGEEGGDHGDQCGVKVGRLCLDFGGHVWGGAMGALQEQNCTSTPFSGKIPGQLRIKDHPPQLETTNRGWFPYAARVGDGVEQPKRVLPASWTS